ncbi:hypothetical protein VB712_10315 [Spirulina sp. CCNP1310]|uniref:hypothetical protein n=1 Tax=Spirulina sp. CCNP1310 TaxID=3110249 RepID=UPI002B207742|nr:hypothetical protein [Spirulina sp. CCNP1310]MEA5419616.1 hypothetical protein [Spirulina sp. CCNP1310]
MTWDKLMHFVVGIATGVGFWWVLERRARVAAGVINPICFLVMLIWGASGLFFLRKLGIPFFSHTLFYMAIPDWDIPLYLATRLRFLIHRSWLFHSVVIPLALLGGWLWLVNIPTLSIWQKTLVKWGRDGAIGLSVGMSAHLIWDALLSSTRRGFYIHGFGGPASYTWLGLNLLVGLGVPLLMAWGISPTRTASGDR